MPRHSKKPMPRAVVPVQKKAEAMTAIQAKLDGIKKIDGSPMGLTVHAYRSYKQGCVSLQVRNTPKRVRDSVQQILNAWAVSPPTQQATNVQPPQAQVPPPPAEPERPEIAEELLGGLPLFNEVQDASTWLDSITAGSQSVVELNLEDAGDHELALDFLELFNRFNVTMGDPAHVMITDDNGMVLHLHLHIIP